MVSCTYAASGTFEVPAGVATLEVSAVGAHGGNVDYFGAWTLLPGGPGASVRAPWVDVSSYQGEQLTVVVGEPGEAGDYRSSGAGGVPGGGPGGSDNYLFGAGGGGGYSGLLAADGTPLVIAAGGGGSGGMGTPSDNLGAGGAGGEPDGSPGQPQCPPYSDVDGCGGGGGTHAGGGTGGETSYYGFSVSGDDGGKLAGGAGGYGGAGFTAGGGGGGGYYGGGGGGGGYYSGSGGGGGGGSSWPADATFGVAEDEPQVVIAYELPGEAAISLVSKTASQNSFTAAGQDITYTYEVKNTGELPLTGTAITDNKVTGITCTDTELAPGAESTCEGTYTTRQADVAAGKITNTARAVGDGVRPDGTRVSVVSTAQAATVPFTGEQPAPAPNKPARPTVPTVRRVPVTG